MPESTKITATELARHLSDILSRVRYRGESFEVLRNGEVVAELRPSAPAKQITWGEFLELWPTFPKPDEDYWKDLEAIHQSQGILEPPREWR